ncbi:MAG TPA: response regulator [Beijerinckiaceae bacterium]
MNRLRILLLEDSDLDAELLRQFMLRSSIPHEITRVMTRDKFEEALGAAPYDIILADYVLPTFDGVSALGIAHALRPDIPFVFVSGTLGEEVVVEALKNGATDFVTKRNLERLPRTVLRALSEAEARRQRERAERELRDLNESLEARIEERTQELERANEELRRQIAEREQVESALRHSQRLEAVGQLTSGVAHDFNNLLTVIIGSVEYLERYPANQAVRRRLDMMRTAAERGARLTTQLLAFSRRQRLEPRPVDLNETVRSMEDLLQSSIGGSVRVETRLSKGLWPAHVDPTHLELVVLNLVVNARDAMAVGGAVTIETSNVTLREPARRPEEPGPGEYVMICVADTGSGIPADVLERVFEPFFTTKEIGKGSGLGLAQVYGFAKQSGGGVRIETEVGVGTAVKVFLPRAAQAPWQEPVANEAPARNGDALAVLVVDDDDAVRETTAAMLSELGYQVSEAGSGRAALERLDGHNRFDLMVVDFAMPGINGAETAAEARRRFPELPILFVTGYAETTALKRVGAKEGLILQKPFRSDDLARKVRAVIDSPEAS